MNVLLVEPDYRSKFPPLGLLRIGALHKERGDAVTFARGLVPDLRLVHWHRVYVSTLFTYELPRAVKTIEYYLPTVDDPSSQIFVGGIGATLLPSYIRERVPCRVIEGPLDKPNMLGLNEGPVEDYIPDYDLIDSAVWQYRPKDAYFLRVTKGCIRKCKFCAVPLLEPKFEYLQGVSEQVEAVKKKFGERRDLIILDNNILALDDFPSVVEDIRREGFHSGATFNRKKRTVDFNQGIDARLITPAVAKLLSSICLSPVRLAYDYDAIEDQYRRAVKTLAEHGFVEFTTYVMFNFNDTPESFYRRLRVNVELSSQLGVRVTGFPMRYVPIDDTDRRFVSAGWQWRYLRGIQCILSATHGVVSPNPAFFEAAFGRSPEEFLEIISMPDQYIIFRSDYKDKASEWQAEYRRLSPADRAEFMSILGAAHEAKPREKSGVTDKRFVALLRHYDRAS